MRFFEYEAREIVSGPGIPVTDFGFATTAEEAREIARRDRRPGRDQVAGPDRRAHEGRRREVRRQRRTRRPSTPRRSWSSRSAATCRAACSSTRKAEVKQEYYAGVVWDGLRKQPVMIFSDMGGIDIEEVAEKHPDHVGRGHFSTILPFSDFRPSR